MSERTPQDVLRELSVEEIAEKELDWALFQARDRGDEASWTAVRSALSKRERAEIFERGRATGTIEGWADHTDAPVQPCHPACRMCSAAHDPRCILDDEHEGMCRDAFAHGLTVLVPVEPDYYDRLRDALAYHLRQAIGEVADGPVAAIREWVDVDGDVFGRAMHKASQVGGSWTPCSVPYASPDCEHGSMGRHVAAIILASGVSGSPHPSAFDTQSSTGGLPWLNGRVDGQTLAGIFMGRHVDQLSQHMTRVEFNALRKDLGNWLTQQLSGVEAPDTLSEKPGLDVERLARALMGYNDPGRHWDDMPLSQGLWRTRAQGLAAEYDRLTSTDSEGR